MRTARVIAPTPLPHERISVTDPLGRPPPGRRSSRAVNPVGIARRVHPACRAARRLCCWRSARSFRRTPSVLRWSCSWRFVWRSVSLSWPRAPSAPLSMVVIDIAVFLSFEDRVMCVYPDGRRSPPGFRRRRGSGAYFPLAGFGLLSRATDRRSFRHRPPPKEVGDQC